MKVGLAAQPGRRSPPAADRRRHAVTSLACRPRPLTSSKVPTHGTRWPLRRCATRRGRGWMPLRRIMPLCLLSRSTLRCATACSRSTARPRARSFAWTPSPPSQTLSGSTTYPAPAPSPGSPQALRPRCCTRAPRAPLRARPRRWPRQCVVACSRAVRPASSRCRPQTQNFITLMDGLKLNQRAVDEVYPLLSALLARSVARPRGCGFHRSPPPRSVNRISFLPPSYEGKAKMEAWCVLVLPRENPVTAHRRPERAPGWPS